MLYRLSEPERRFLTTCLKGHNAKLDISWNHLYKNAKLGKSQIQYLSEKFRRLSYINKKDYNINKNKLEEIKALLQYNKKEDKEEYNIWDFFINNGLIIITIILIVSTTFMIMSTSFIGLEMTAISPKEALYSINTNSKCIPIENRDINNKTLYLDKECKFMYNSKEKYNSNKILD